MAWRRWRGVKNVQHFISFFATPKLVFIHAPLQDAIAMQEQQEQEL
jgi:hypothetical protein